MNTILCFDLPGPNLAVLLVNFIRVRNEVVNENGIARLALNAWKFDVKVATPNGARERCQDTGNYKKAT